MTCLDIFDANCPEFFAPNERQEYENFLNCDSKGYEVCDESEGRAFFAKLGATPTSSTVDGWGPGMDRVDMVLAL